MKITITGIPLYTGVYEVDFDRLTVRDLSTVKRISGHMPLDIENAAERGDTDLGVAFAIIALRRHGFQRINEDALWDSELGAIKIDLSDSDEDADAVPPQSASETVTPSPPSGSPSSIVSELHPANPPSITGTRSSEPPDSDRAISAT